MKQNNLFTHNATPIAQSIASYRENLMKDISFSLRLTYGEKTHATHLADWTDDLVIFEAPMQGLDYIMLPDSSLLDAIFTTRTSIFSTTLRVLKKYRKGNSLYYVAQIVKPLVKKQQRDAYRLDVLLDVNYTISSSSQEESSVQNPASSKGTCLNISVGGMCLACDKQYHAKDHIELDFHFINHAFKLAGEILFLGKLNESGLYIHRIRFINLHSSDKNLLNKLIFEKQRLQLKIHNN